MFDTTIEATRMFNKGMSVLLECNRKRTERLNKTEQPTVMNNETITIEAPEGQVFDLENSTPTHIKLKKVESNKRPMSWSELGNIKGFYISSSSAIRDANCVPTEFTRDVWPTKKLAEAALALSQLLQLRDAWNECNTEEGNLDTHQFGIRNSLNSIETTRLLRYYAPLRFKTIETRDAFLEQFRPLIETALPLL